MLCCGQFHDTCSFDRMKQQRNFAVKQPSCARPEAWRAIAPSCNTCMHIMKAPQCAQGFNSLEQSDIRRHTVPLPCRSDMNQPAGAAVATTIVAQASLALDASGLLVGDSACSFNWDRSSTANTTVISSHPTAAAATPGVGGAAAAGTVSGATTAIAANAARRTRASDSGYIPSDAAQQCASSGKADGSVSGRVLNGQLMSHLEELTVQLLIAKPPFSAPPEAPDSKSGGPKAAKAAPGRSSTTGAAAGAAVAAASDQSKSAAAGLTEGLTAAAVAQLERGVLLPQDLAARLNPLVVWVTKAKNLPDAPAAAEQLDRKCDPVALSVCWPPGAPAREQQAAAVGRWRRRGGGAYEKQDGEGGMRGASTGRAGVGFGQLDVTAGPAAARQPDATIPMSPAAAAAVEPKVGQTGAQWMEGTAKVAAASAKAASQAATAAATGRGRRAVSQPTSSSRRDDGTMLFEARPSLQIRAVAFGRPMVLLGGDAGGPEGLRQLLREFPLELEVLDRRAVVEPPEFPIPAGEGEGATAAVSGVDLGGRVYRCGSLEARQARGVGLGLEPLGRSLDCVLVWGITLVVALVLPMRSYIRLFMQCSCQARVFLGSGIP